MRTIAHPERDHPVNDIKNLGMFVDFPSPPCATASTPHQPPSLTDVCAVTLMTHPPPPAAAVDNTGEERQWADAVNRHTTAATVASEQASPGAAASTAAARAQAQAQPSFSVLTVMSDNVHEARGYNRLARLARAPLLALLQDDIYPSKSGRWLQQAQRLFTDMPHLGVVGTTSHKLCLQGGWGWEGVGEGVVGAGPLAGPGSGSSGTDSDLDPP